MSRIVLYEPAYRQAFVDLNIAWIEEYFELEPPDYEIFEHLEERILLPGGQIFFCLDHQSVVGTVALLRLDERTFELGKMAVRKSERGKGYAKPLLEACLRFAAEQGAESLVLYSNTSLTPALNLYRSYGFVEVPIEHNLYSRADIKMQLSLRTLPDTP